MTTATIVKEENVEEVENKVTRLKLEPAEALKGIRTASTFVGRGLFNVCEALTELHYNSHDLIKEMLEEYIPLEMVTKLSEKEFDSIIKEIENVEEFKLYYSLYIITLHASANDLRDALEFTKYATTLVSEPQEYLYDNIDFFNKIIEEDDMFVDIEFLMLKNSRLNPSLSSEESKEYHLENLAELILDLMKKQHPDEEIKESDIKYIIQKLGLSDKSFKDIINDIINNIIGVGPVANNAQNNTQASSTLGKQQEIIVDEDGTQINGNVFTNAQYNATLAKNAAIMNGAVGRVDKKNLFNIQNPIAIKLTENIKKKILEKDNSAEAIVDSAVKPTITTKDKVEEKDTTEEIVDTIVNDPTSKEIKKKQPVIIEEDTNKRPATPKKTTTNRNSRKK